MIEGRAGVHRAYIGLGSNLDGPIARVAWALDALDRIEQTRCVRRSPLYRTRPLGPPAQPHYINAVALLQTALQPEALLDALQALESAQGRQRGPERWEPRTLDLDILIFDDLRIATQRLSVPHPRLHLRAFVLYPLAEIAPGLVIPGRGKVLALRDALGREGIQRLSKPC